MKKVVFALLLIFVFFANFIFAEELVSEKTCEIKEIYLFEEETKGLTNLKKEEFEEDLEMLCYLLRTAYIGYFDMQKKGFDCELFKEAIRNKFAGQETFSSKHFAEVVNEYLSDYIFDSHFAIEYLNETFHPLQRKFIAFSNTYVKKFENQYVALKGGTAKAGSIYTGSEENLFLYPAKGEDIYRIGMFVLENEKILKYDFEFNEKPITLPIKVEKPIEPLDYNISNSFETKNSGYVSITSFLPSYDENSLIEIDKFLQKSIEFQNKKNIIIDLRGNFGGFPLFPARFAVSLYDNYDFVSSNLDEEYPCDSWSVSFLDSYNVYSISTLKMRRKTNIHKEDDIYYEQEIEELKKRPVVQIYKYDGVLAELAENMFNGNIIFVIDNNTASASEAAIFQFREFFDEQVFVVGTNSLGALEYGNLQSAYLKNSGIKLYLTIEKFAEIQDFYPEWKGETIGIFPDYWSSKEDLSETIYKITNDKKMKKLLKEKLF